jgi:hypothetical protein
VSDTTKHRLWSRVWFIVLAAFVLRLVVVSFLVGNELNPARDHWTFGWETGRIARSLASGHGFASPLLGPTGPTAWLGPIYPCLLAAVFKIFGIYSKASAYVILALNCLFAALTCLPVHSIGGRAFGTKTALGAAWAWALFPYSINFSAGQVWCTALAAMLFTSVIAVTLELEQEFKIRTWVAWGTLWALCGLTEPSLLSCLPVAGLWLFFRLRQRGRPWTFLWRPATAALAFLVCVSPWFVRNYRVFGRFIPFRNSFWLVLYQGNTWDTFDLYPDWANPPHNTTDMEEYGRVGEVAYMLEKKQLAIAEVRQHPARFGWATLRRVVFTWTGYWDLSKAYREIEPLALPNVFLTTLLSVFSFAGLRLAFEHSRRNAILFAGLLLAFPCVYYITHPSMAYRHPLDPFLVLLAVDVSIGQRKRFEDIPESAAKVDYVLETSSEAPALQS